MYSWLFIVCEVHAFSYRNHLQTRQTMKEQQTEDNEIQKNGRIYDNLAISFFSLKITVIFDLKSYLR